MSKKGKKHPRARARKAQSNGKNRTSKRTAASRPSKTGADRKPGEHIMSVHIPTDLLAKLDKKVAAICSKADKKGASSRSAFSVSAIRSALG